jgi:tetratricopeptide (TPR) repeat protein
MANIFVSYTSDDRDWAFWIGHELDDLGHRARLHEWELSAGGDIMAWMEKVHHEAQHILCVISKMYLDKPYSSLERRAAQWAATTDRPNFALPVLIEDCELPTLLAPFKRCDLYDIDEAEAKKKLAAFLTPAGKPKERGAFPSARKVTLLSTEKPAEAPIFPGGLDAKLDEIKAQMREFQALLASKQEVEPKVLEPIFRALGKLDITPDEMRAQAEQAVKEIVALAEERSKPSDLGADIDKAIEEARALLKELRTADALDLLRKKDAEAQEAVKDAVQRRVALLKEQAQIERATRDYEAAKKTFAEVARLEPESGWALIELGDLEVISGPSEAALAAFRAALTIDRRVGDDVCVGLALVRIGQVLLARNNLDGALEHFTEGFDIRRRLARADPSHAERARDVSVSLVRIGDVLVAPNNLDGALEHFTEGLDIFRRLARADPSHAERARDVSVSLAKLAQIDGARGDAVSALAKFCEAREIIAALRTKSPDLAGLKNDLAWLDRRIAKLEGKPK